MMNKKCRKCREIKDISEFNSDRLGKYGVGSTCKECINSNKKVYNIKKNPLKNLGRKRIDRIKKYGSESEVFEEIKNERSICEICNNPVINIQPWCFAHILGKRNYPKYRYFKNNIAYVCSEKCHGEVDYRVTGNKLEIEKDIILGKKIDLEKYKKD